MDDPGAFPISVVTVDERLPDPVWADQSTPRRSSGSRHHLVRAHRPALRSEPTCRVSLRGRVDLQPSGNGDDEEPNPVHLDRLRLNGEVWVSQFVYTLAHDFGVELCTDERLRAVGLVANAEDDVPTRGIREADGSVRQVGKGDLRGGAPLS